MSPLAVAWVSGEGEQQILAVGTSDGSKMTSGGNYRLKTLLVQPTDLLGLNMLIVDITQPLID